VDAPGGGLIDYGKIDSLGRRSGIEACLTPKMMNTGTKASGRTTPPGYRQGRLYARSHLLAKLLGGSGDV
jgi:hypothetical protein